MIKQRYLKLLQVKILLEVREQDRVKFNIFY